jgi:hypothetical protein
VDITKAAERAISEDLEELIGKAVNKNVADYAVVTGVQIHNWHCPNKEAGAPNLEFVYPVQVYTMVNGVKTVHNLADIAPVTPRMTKLLAVEDKVRGPFAFKAPAI